MRPQGTLALRGERASEGGEKRGQPGGRWAEGGAKASCQMPGAAEYSESRELTLGLSS